MVLHGGVAALYTPVQVLFLLWKDLFTAVRIRNAKDMVIGHFEHVLVAAIRTSKDSLHERELVRITSQVTASGKWLQTPPSYVNGTCLSEMEYRDAL